MGTDRRGFVRAGVAAPGLMAGLPSVGWSRGARAGGRTFRLRYAPHFGIELEYPNGARVLSMCRLQDGTARFVGEVFQGTRGASDARSYILGTTEWTYAGAVVNPYVQEHTDLVASIRAGTPLNEGKQVAESTLTAIMAREAAYTGQVITWDQILVSDLDLGPAPVAFEPRAVPSVPQPGVTFDLLPIALVPADRSALHRRIALRFDAMLAAGLVEELEGLRARYALHPGLPSMRCVGYRQA